ncbi:MAG TPA: L,D-transpeptidase family protein [Gemmatimonadales bacterium]|nr:L,D-transpeptidase family protein [Gemmatimonadales bacterium]
MAAVWALLLAVLVQGEEASSRAPRSREDSVAVHVQQQLRAASLQLYENRALLGFYGRRAFRAAWSSEHGPNRLADDFVEAIGRADLDGLEPEDYRLSHIRALLDTVRADAAKGRAPAPDRLAQLDILLSDAFLLYGSHLLSGRVDPETLHPMWEANRRGADLAMVLEDALASRKIARALQRLAPNDAGYQRLREALARERAIAARGGWSRLAAGAPSDALRERLQIEGDWKEGDSLSIGVRRFQRRHGLAVTGTVDAATYATLNVTAQAKVEQLRLNLERWRWLPQDLGRRRIMVNIAAQELDVIEDDESVLHMRVVVGGEYRRTPVFSDTVRYIVLNPNWHVPTSIALQEVIPKALKDSTYFERFGMRLMTAGDTQAVDPRTIEWSTVTADNFPYRVRQDPGRLNALGRMKFMFPNRYDIYLHDTPSRRLFAQPQRDFSHGCIRLEKPLDLAVYLMKKSRWNRDAIEAALDEGTERTIYLPRPTSVHLLYWTAWADDEGVIQFRPDINDVDDALAAALDAPLRPTREAKRN